MVVGETVALQCKALGSPPPRITWLKGEEPLRPSDRHHFTPGNQLLVIGTTTLEDAGRYTCVMSNTLGTERAHCQLNVYQRFEDCAPFTSPSTVTVGIIVIAVVTSIVVTSLVWVCIIYQTRKKSEECSVNTGAKIYSHRFSFLFRALHVVQEEFIFYIASLLSKTFALAFYRRDNCPS